ncbi:hypothetical protein JCM16303_003279 [Sporobolomyces ruberrimus]
MDDEWEAEAVYNDWATAGAEAAKKVPTTLTAQAVQMLQPVFDMGCATGRLSTSDFAKMFIEKLFFCQGTRQMAFALYPAVVIVARYFAYDKGLIKRSYVLFNFVITKFVHPHHGTSLQAHAVVPWTAKSANTLLGAAYLAKEQGYTNRPLMLFARMMSHFGGLTERGEPLNDDTVPPRSVGGIINCIRVNWQWFLPCVLETWGRG